MATVELKITGLKQLERILKEFKDSGQIEKVIRKSIEKALEPEPPKSRTLVQGTLDGLIENMSLDYVVKEILKWIIEQWSNQ